MARERGAPERPDRLTAVLDELDAVRRPVGWTPTQDSLVDSRRPAVQPIDAGMSRGAARAARTARPARPATTATAARSGSHRLGDGTDVRPHAPLLRTPTALRGAQVAPARLAVVGVVVLVLVVALILGGRVLLARASATATPVATSTGGGSAVTSTSGAPRFGAAGATSAARTPTATAAAQVVVQVVGQVRRPGVVTLRGGSRVQDAVAAAGGALPSADLSAVNLARVVSDGEQIQVPKPGQQMTAPVGGGAAAGPGSSASTGSPNASGAPGAPVNLNTADATGLDALPGVGPVLAARIVQWRTENGRFTSVDEPGEVSGIGDKVLARLRPLVTV